VPRRSSHPALQDALHCDQTVAICNQPRPSPLRLRLGEREFCERLQYDMLFKWFLSMNIGDAAFDPTTFSKNRNRLLEHEVAHRFFEAVRGEAERRRLLSDEHFTLDGTLLEAWASVKSVRPKDDDDRTPPQGRNVAVDCHGERRRNEPMRPRLTPRRSWRRRVMAPRPSRATRDTCSWRTATGWWWEQR
jgi:hypothetical protein